ncbi:MAG TPA: DUF3298 domain-containing protein [Mycolicibacterium fallax]|nr:DUF3298 domain-containing protein [Mycolicibacterium fallax]
MNFARIRRAALALVLLAVAASPAPAIADPSPSAALCAEVGGNWDGAAGQCSATATNANQINVEVSADFPVELVEDPTTGPPLRAFLRDFFTKFGHPADALIRDGRARLTSRVLTGAPNTTSVLFSNDWYLGGPHPNDELDTFTFDRHTGRQLALADLFCSTDPVEEQLEPLVKKYVRSTYTPTDGRSELPDYTRYTDGYRAWLLDGDELVIYLPSYRTGPVHAGMFVARIPTSELRAGDCAT